MPVEIHAAVRTGLGVENFRPRFAWAGSVFDKLDDVELGAFNALLRTHAHTVEDIGTLMIYLPAISIDRPTNRSEEHTSELQSIMRNSYAVFCLNKKKQK